MFSNDQRSFSDKVLDALESGAWMTWSELMASTGLTLFWVRETMSQATSSVSDEEGVEEGDDVYKYRLSDSQVAKAWSLNTNNSERCAQSGSGLGHSS